MRIMLFVTIGVLLGSVRGGYAQWSYREGDPEPPMKSDVLFQRFTKAEWDASNFASAEDLKWFRDAKVGFLASFGLATHNNAEAAWGLCYTRKAPDNFKGNGPIADDVWPTYAKETKVVPFRVRISSDGKTWTPAGDAYSDGGIMEITLTRFENGAWVPGRNARYVRVHCSSGSADALRLRQIEIWGQ